VIGALEPVGIQFQSQWDCEPILLGMSIGVDIEKRGVRESCERELFHTIEITRVVVLELHQIVFEAAVFCKKNIL
jgi:hypothetical protein